MSKRVNELTLQEPIRPFLSGEAQTSPWLISHAVSGSVGQEPRWLVVSVLVPRRHRLHLTRYLCLQCKYVQGDGGSIKVDLSMELVKCSYWATPPHSLTCLHLLRSPCTKTSFTRTGLPPWAETRGDKYRCLTSYCIDCLRTHPDFGSLSSWIDFADRCNVGIPIIA